MTRYITLLRGINVGGHRKIKMADLKILIEGLDCSNVNTYVQSGNVVFSATENKEFLSHRITDRIQERFGFEVTVLVLDVQELERILKAFPFDASIQKDAYYTLLSKLPDAERIVAFESINFPEEAIKLLEKCVYFYTSKGMGKAKYSNNLAEKKLKVSATTRNHRTLCKLIEMAQDN